MRGTDVVITDQPATRYYEDKLETLGEVFGTPDIGLEEGSLRVGERRFPILNDVIVLMEPAKYSDALASALGSGPTKAGLDGFSKDEQYAFSEEWTQFGGVLPEHAETLHRYFDLVDPAALSDQRVCDLGCGSGRWSYFLKDACRQLVLVDFSDGIFVARENLRGADNCLFFMADITDLPFADNFADFIFCLGVLHYLPTPCLEELRKLRRLAPTQLFSLYYALDNRPVYFRALLALVTTARVALSRIRNRAFRKLFARAIAVLVYRPLLAVGSLLKPFGLADKVPLYEGYHANKGSEVLAQNVYNRFFNPIEQRVSRREIEALNDTFAEVVVSENLPYWHFLCRR
jgi:SAM-dependent methyltransferase